MDNRNIANRGAKRRRVNSSSAVQNQSKPHKIVIIFDDAWLEALKHLTCPKWSEMSLVSRQIKGNVQRNASRLPRLVIESITLDSQYLSFNPRFASIASSLQELFHPLVYIKNVAMRTVNQSLIDTNFNGEERYIRCHKFELLPYSDMMSAPQKVAKSLEWLERNVRSNSISFPEWMFNRIHNTVKIREKLTNFIFDTSQKCTTQELVLSVKYNGHSYYNSGFSSVKLVDALIEDFMALPVVQGTIPTVVINYYPIEEKYRAKFGENLIGREVDSQGADALYEIDNGDKRIRISFIDRYPDFIDNFLEEHKAYLKFYTI